MLSEKKSTTIRQLLEEAEDNHKTKRYRDSAKIFHSIAKKAIEEDFVEDGIYFMYRTIIGYDKSEDELDKISTLLILGQTCLQYASKLSSRRIEFSQDRNEKIKAIQLAQKAMELLGNDENRVPLLKSLVRLYYDRAKKESGTSKITSLEKAYELAIEYNRSLAHRIGLEVVRSYQEAAEKTVEKGGLEPYDTALYYQTRAIKFAVDNGITISPELQDRLAMYSVNIADHIQDIDDREKLEKEKDRLDKIRKETLVEYGLQWMEEESERRSKFSDVSMNLVVDGPNVLWEGEVSQSEKNPNLPINKFDFLLEQLKELGYTNVTIVCSGATQYHVDDKKKYKKLIKRGIIKQTPAGRSDDYFALELAKLRDGMILSNDQYSQREKQEDREWIESHRITYIWDSDTGSFIFDKKLG